MSQFGQHCFLKNVYLRRSFEAISVSIQNFAPFCRISDHMLAYCFNGSRRRTNDGANAVNVVPVLVSSF